MPVEIFRRQYRRRQVAEKAVVLERRGGLLIGPVTEMTMRASGLNTTNYPIKFIVIFVKGF